MDVGHDGIDIFDLFLGRVGVVHPQVADAAEFARDAEVEADRFGMADVEIAVRLRRETGVDPRVLSAVCTSSATISRMKSEGAEVSLAVQACGGATLTTPRPLVILRWTGKLDASSPRCAIYTLADLQDWENKTRDVSPPNRLACGNMVGHSVSAECKMPRSRSAELLSNMRAFKSRLTNWRQRSSDCVNSGSSAST